MSLGKVAVIGQGYVGLPLAVAASQVGWKVIGIDRSARVVDALNHGVSHIEDVSDSELLAIKKSGAYRITSDFNEVRDCEICIICVPTPIDDAKLPDLTNGKPFA